MNVCNNVDWISRADLRFYSRWTEIVADLFGRARGRVRRQDSASKEFVETSLILRLKKSRMKIANAFHFETQEILKSIKMISAQHSSNNGKNWQKLRYPKNPLNMVIF